MASLACAAVAAISAFGFATLPGEMRDFEVYWTAAQRSLEASPLYRPADGHFQFKYLPAFAVLAMPLALVPLALAKSLWFIASMALIPVLIWLAIEILPATRRSPRLLAIIIVIAMAKFYAHELVLGQVNLLFAVVAALTILLLKKGRGHLAAGACVAAVLIKPYAVIFLPWIVVATGIGAGSTAVAGLVAGLAMPAAVYGFHGTMLLHREWWQTVTSSTAPNLVNNDNVSVAGMFAQWLGAGGPASLLPGVTCAALIAAAALVVARRRQVPQPAPLEGALLLLLIPLVSPQGWDYVFLIATPAVALFANYDDLLPPALRWTAWSAIIIVGLSLFDVMGRERYAAFMAWSVISVCFLVLVTALSALRFRSVV